MLTIGRLQCIFPLTVRPNGHAERCEDLVQMVVSLYNLIPELARPFGHTTRHKDLGQTTAGLYNILLTMVKPINYVEIYYDHI